jgi:hypothetical protein
MSLDTKSKLSIKPLYYLIKGLHMLKNHIVRYHSTESELLATDSEVPGSIPGPTTFSEK